MALIPEVDERASRNKARDMLKSYRRLSRMAGRPLVDYQSPTIDDMPKAQSFRNNTEAGLISRLSKRFDAEAEMRVIDNALALIPFRSHWVLYFSYCTPEELTTWQVADRLGVEGPKVVDYLKHIALLQFAEAYPEYRLMVFK